MNPVFRINPGKHLLHHYLEHQDQKVRDLVLQKSIQIVRAKLLDKIEKVSSTGDDYHIDIEDIENLQKAQEQIKLLNLDFVTQRSELLKAFIRWNNKHNGIAQPVPGKMADNYLKSL